MATTPARMRNARGRPQPHRETLNKTAWCEACRKMHEPEQHVCPHRREVGTCVECEAQKSREGARAMSALDLPPLDGFTRDELEALVRILHGGLVRAQSDYAALAATLLKTVAAVAP